MVGQHFHALLTCCWMRWKLRGRKKWKHSKPWVDKRGGMIVGGVDEDEGEARAAVKPYLQYIQPLPLLSLFGSGT